MDEWDRWIWGALVQRVRGWRPVRRRLTASFPGGRVNKLAQRGGRWRGASDGGNKRKYGGRKGVRDGGGELTKDTQRLRNQAIKESWSKREKDEWVLNESIMINQDAFFALRRSHSVFLLRLIIITRTHTRAHTLASQRRPLCIPIRTAAHTHRGSIQFRGPQLASQTCRPVNLQLDTPMKS